MGKNKGGKKGEGSKERKLTEGMKGKIEAGGESALGRGRRRRVQGGTEGGTGRPNATTLLHPSFL